jgi:hypothetical protein
LIGFLSEWRYDASLSEEGDVVIDWFAGEKLGDDGILWDALAPAVEEDSQIQCRGEDGALWRWYFEHGTVIEQDGKVVYRE